MMLSGETIASHYINSCSALQDLWYYVSVLYGRKGEQMAQVVALVEALKAATVSAKSALESTQAGYEVGTRTIVDVLNVQRNLFSSQRDYLGSRYDYIINGVSLKSAAGTLGAEDLKQVNTWLEP